MEITDFKDFYIDLNGDVKASTGDKKAIFLTTSEKFNSQYLITNDINELQSKIHDVNATFDVKDKPVFKQYSIKTDQNDNVVGIKIYADYNDNQDGLKFILIGYDITSLGVEVDYYFLGNVDLVTELIKKHNLIYEIKTFDTHAPFLFSIKKDENGNVINFKTYYGLKTEMHFYSEEFIPTLKNTLRFI